MCCYAFSLRLVLVHMNMRCKNIPNLAAIGHYWWLLVAQDLGKGVLIKTHYVF